MSRQRFLFVDPVPGFAVTSIRSLVQLALQSLLVLSNPTAAHDAPSSILSGAKHTVPDYVARYAPLVWLHSEDPFRPADLLKHIQHTTPTINQKPLSGLPEKLDLDNLAVLNDADGGRVSLTSNDDITALPSWLLGETPDESGKVLNSTPCMVILVERSPSEVDAFFFYFYSYDRGPNITQVLPPLNGLIEDTEDGMHFGDHVGDWEHNMVRFQDGKPRGIYYSQHRDGSAYDWDDEGLSLKDERPIVFSAYGSHANYASDGDHIHDDVLVDYCDAGLIWDPVLSAYFYHLDPDTFTLTRLLPPGSNVSAASNLTSFFYFDGIWGDAQYPDDHPRQKVVPYFGLKRFVSGPQGPAVKHLVRKGLMPDHRRTKSWLEWGVGVFMSLYPCCFRGWRVWVSLVVLAGLIVLVVLGVKFGLRRYRTRRQGYKKVDTEIAMEEIGSRENLVSSSTEEDESR